jgi:hypothetical protein
MLDPEPAVLDGRQAFLDAQAAYAGQVVPLGFFTCSWYGTAVQDERGSFAVVDPAMGLANAVGEVVQIQYQRRTVNVYVLGSQDGLGTDIGVTRRSYMAFSLLAQEPVTVTVGAVS